MTEKSRLPQRPLPAFHIAWPRISGSIPTRDGRSFRRVPSELSGHRAWLVALVIGSAAMTSSCFSRMNVARYQSDSYPNAAMTRTALMPLILRRAQQENKSLSLGPGFVQQEALATALSPAEYVPAAQLTESRISEVMAGRTIRSAKEVMVAMKNAQPTNLTEAVSAVAKTTDSDSVLLVEVSDFFTAAAGLENAQASGRTDVSVFDPEGSLVWSLSAQVVKRAIGSNAAPTLSEYLAFALDELEPEIKKMLEKR